MKKILRVFVKEDCRECNNMRLKIDQVLSEPHINLTVYYIDADRFPRTAADAEVKSVPTMVLYRDDAIIWRRIGPLPYHDLRENLES